MKVSVTERDIREGVVGDCDYCPVALAATRAIAEAGGAAAVTATDEALTVYGERTVSFIAPTSVREFIMAFDRRKPVEPFDFELEGYAFD